MLDDLNLTKALPLRFYTEKKPFGQPKPKILADIQKCLSRKIQKMDIFQASLKPER